MGRNEFTYWVHKKTKGVYQILHEHGLREHDLEPVVVYQSCDDRQVWVRPSSEFFDGRFELATTDNMEKPSVQ